MILKSACFLGHSKIPCGENSSTNKEFEKVLNTQIKGLMWEGVSEFYVGGQTAFDMLAARLTLRIRDDLFSTANLHVILPFRSIAIPLGACESILDQASTVTCLNENYYPRCYRKNYEYMIQQCTYLVAVHAGREKSETQIAISLAKKHDLKVIIINPDTLEVTH